MGGRGEEKRMEKDNLVLITMVVFFVVMLVIAVRAVFAGDPARDRRVRSESTADDAAATTTQGQPDDAQAVAQQGASEGASIWTADDTGLLRPVSYPVPTTPEIAPTMPPVTLIDREIDADDSGHSSNHTYAVSVGPFIY